MQIDQKYKAKVTKHDGTEVTDYIIFRAQDMAVPAMLEAYMIQCTALGADAFHIAGIHKLRDRVMEYQHRQFSKIPDSTPEDFRQ